MLNLLLIIGMLIVFGKLFVFGLKAAWGISKFIVSVVLLPLALLFLILKGILTLAVPILIIVAVIAFMKEA